MSRMRSLQGSVALVTGGAGGLGAATALALARAGARIAVADLDGARIAPAVEAVRDAGGEAVSVPLDVASAGDVQRGVQATLDAFGALDVLVNCAGTDVTLPLDDLAVEEFERVLRVNLHGPFLMTKAALPALRASQGQVVNVVSTAARRAWPNASAYHASKWGLLGLSHALHAELRGEGIRVTAVIAGGMRTPFITDRFPEVDAESLQDPCTVAETIRFALELPEASVVPEIMVLPMRETSWP